MEVTTMITAIVSFLAGSVKNSKGFTKAFDETSQAIWNWIKPILIIENKKDELLEKLESDPNNIQTRQGLENKIKKYLDQYSDKAFELESIVRKMKVEFEADNTESLIQKIENQIIIKGDNHGSFSFDQRKL